MRIYSLLLVPIVAVCTSGQAGQTATFKASAKKPQFVYVGNIGDDSVSVFSIKNNGTLKPVEPRVTSPICGMPSLLTTGGHILLVGGEFTNACNPSELGGGTVYLYPIRPSGKLGPVSIAYLNDVESIALDRAGRLAFSSGATLNPHDEVASINGWNVTHGDLDTSLPGSPTNFFDFQTGNGLLPDGIAVSGNSKFLYATFDKYSDYNRVGDGLIGVLSLLLDGGIGSFVHHPVAGCRGPKISGQGPSAPLLTVTLKSKTVVYYPCVKGAGVNVPGTPVIGLTAIDSSTGKITKVYNAFLPPSRIPLVPVAVDPSGKWLAASNGLEKIDMLAINQTSGTLSELPHHIFNLGATSVAFDHRARFLYAAQTNMNVVAAFAFNPQIGVVKLPELGKQSTGPSPVAVTVARP